MEFVHQAIDLFLHLDVHLNEWATMLGPWLYGVLFVIVFCETGLVVTPFLPGDSLLFAIGALTAMDGSPINLPFVVLLLCIAAIAGDALNYSAGYFVGPRIFTQRQSHPPGSLRAFLSRLLNQQHLLRTQAFYEKYGGKTIIVARFMPIIRTFAPFVAGIGKMQYARFATFNVVGGVAWVAAFVLGGFFFGNVPVVKRNFHFVILAIVFISLLPPVLEFLRARREGRAASRSAG